MAVTSNKKASKRRNGRMRNFSSERMKNNGRFYARLVAMSKNPVCRSSQFRASKQTTHNCSVVEQCPTIPVSGSIGLKLRAGRNCPHIRLIEHKDRLMAQLTQVPHVLRSWSRAPHPGFQTYSGGVSCSCPPPSPSTARLTLSAPPPTSTSPATSSPCACTLPEEIGALLAGPTGSSARNCGARVP